MRPLVFDTGPIISFALNQLLWVLRELKQRYSGEFSIPEAVKEELVDKPFAGMRYRLEVFQVLELIRGGVLTVHSDSGLQSISARLEGIANRIMLAKGHPVRILQHGECEAIALAKNLGASALVVDERTTRLLIEQPEGLRRLMQAKLHTSVRMDKQALREFSALTRGIRIVRSVELATVAFELGIFERYYENLYERAITKPREELLEALLWGLKYRGASVAQGEIEKIIKIERRITP